ncbi:MAG: type II toxin-antitoxin system RelE/ParE family toxin [Candidatus Bipolaricaulota bacterium]
MAYTVLLVTGALKDYRQLPSDVEPRVAAVLDRLEDSPRPRGTVKIGTNAWRLRIGEYRLLYEVDDAEKKVTVFRIRHRKEAYRGWKG